MEIKQNHSHLSFSSVEFLVPAETLLAEWQISNPVSQGILSIRFPDIEQPQHFTGTLIRSKFILQISQCILHSHAYMSF